MTDPSNGALDARLKTLSDRVAFVAALGTVAYYGMRREAQLVAAALQLQRTEDARRVNDLDRKVAANVAAIDSTETRVNKLNGGLILLGIIMPAVVTVVTAVAVYLVTKK